MGLGLWEARSEEETGGVLGRVNKGMFGDLFVCSLFVLFGCGKMVIHLFLGNFPAGPTFGNFLV